MNSNAMCNWKLRVNKSNQLLNVNESGQTVLRDSFWDSAVGWHLVCVVSDVATGAGQSQAASIDLNIFIFFSWLFFFVGESVGNRREKWT